jgi:4-amino-4-deoxy-L-arabinose transferase-like glycosyltransferase
VTAADHDARLAPRLVIAAIVAFPALLFVVAALPEGIRKTAYLAGIALIAAVSIAGGWKARRALEDGTELRSRAAITAVVGLTVGIAVAALSFWLIVAEIA